MDIRITQLDGKLPNLALMRLAAFHKARGDTVHFHRSPRLGLMEPTYGAVYGSAIFETTRPHVEILKAEFPGAIVGGTGSGDAATVEQIVGDFDGLDYEPWPDFTASIGFSQRGCRFNCGFCVVPGKEGKPKSVATIGDIWRGAPYPKHLHLLDNDFFGQPKAQWKGRLAEVREGGFAVCFSQGINIRVITDEIAAELRATDYRSASFVDKKGKPDRKIYTAWDSLGDEDLFFKGVDRLERAGVPPSHLRVYMLVGYDPGETWATVMHRFNRMAARRIQPFPMIYGDRTRRIPLGGHNRAVGHHRLMDFYRWVCGTAYRRGVEFENYDPSMKAPPKFGAAGFDLFDEAA